MKNVIVFDTEKGVPELVLVSSPKNSIYFRVVNPMKNAKIMIFYGSTYQYTISDLTQDIQIPTVYVSDAEMIHIKYVDTVTHINLHVIGNETLYDDLILSRKENNLFFCAGTKSDETDIESIDSIYLKKLAKLINSTTLPAIKCCYDDLATIKKRLDKELIRLGALPGKTVDESVSNLSGVETKPQNFDGYVASIQYFQMNSFDFKSMNATLTEVTE